MITVSVKPNSPKEHIEKLGSGEYRICVTEPAQDNKANKRVIALLARELGVSWRAIKLKNARSRKKYITIEETHAQI